jgi:hypothetical protein
MQKILRKIRTLFADKTQLNMRKFLNLYVNNRIENLHNIDELFLAAFVVDRTK